MKENVRGSLSVSMMPAVVLALTGLSLMREAPAQSRGQGVDAGPASEAGYYALIIGNNDYGSLGRLKTAVNDAKSIEKLLREDYGFQTELLLNAKRDDIIGAVNGYRGRLSAASHFVIYYAGHGHFDKDVEEAYWLPVDAQRSNNARWISSDDITRNLKGIAATHILIISDSCYSGLIGADSRWDPGVGIATLERAKMLEKMRQRKSRLLMASGGNEPVTDSGGGDHSIFARALLRGLKEMESDEFSGMEIFGQFIVRGVGGNSDQLPQYRPIRNSGDDGGDFVFERRHATSPAKSPTVAPARPTEEYLDPAPLISYQKAKHVDVPAHKDWTATGVILQRGDIVRITATGAVSLLSGGYGLSGPKGIELTDTRRLMLDHPTGALIAVIGADNDDFIFIGSSMVFTATRMGLLFLSVNESTPRDNSGSFKAAIEVKKR